MFSPKNKLRRLYGGGAPFVIIIFYFDRQWGEERSTTTHRPISFSSFFMFLLAFRVLS